MRRQDRPVPFPWGSQAWRDEFARRRKHQPDWLARDQIRMMNWCWRRFAQPGERCLALTRKGTPCKSKAEAERQADAECTEESDRPAHRGRQSPRQGKSAASLETLVSRPRVNGFRAIANLQRILSREHSAWEAGQWRSICLSGRGGYLLGTVFEMGGSHNVFL
jgi:hypothetical protein